MQLPGRSSANLLTLSQPVSVRFDFPSLFLTHYAFDQFPKINTNYPFSYSTGTSRKWRSQWILSSVLETFSFKFFLVFSDSLFGSDEMFPFGDSFYCEKTLLSTWKRKEKVTYGRVLLCLTWLLVFLSSFPSGGFGFFTLIFSFSLFFFHLFLLFFCFTIYLFLELLVSAVLSCFSTEAKICLRTPMYS